MLRIPLFTCRRALGAFLLTAAVLGITLAFAPAPALAAARTNTAPAPAPQNAVLTKFVAKSIRNHTVELQWKMTNDLSVVGFYVWKRSSNEAWVRLNQTMLGVTEPSGLESSSFGVKDARVKHAHTYFYQLQIIQADGSSEWSDPVSVTLN